MRRLIALVLVLGACAAPTGADLQLRDPEVLSAIGVETPGTIQWRRSIGRYELQGTTASADPSEVAVLTAGAAELPESWTVEPRQIVRVRNLGQAAEGFEAAGEALGPDIRLGDTTFTTQGRPTQRFEIARVLAHELVHVDQFDTLSADYLDRLLAGQLDEIRLWEGSTLILDFAAATGWVDVSDGELPEWRLPSDIRAATPYGRTNPAEDMAETVALAVIGLGNHLDRDRGNWVEDYLGADLDDLADGKPYVPTDAVSVESGEPLFDVTAAQLAAAPFTREEPQYHRLPDTAPALEILALEIQDQLTRRRLTGALIEDDTFTVPRFAGLFTRADGVRFWVEVIDFRRAPDLVSGPPVPILTYVVYW